MDSQEFDNFLGSNLTPDFLERFSAVKTEPQFQNNFSNNYQMHQQQPHQQMLQQQQHQQQEHQQLMVQQLQSNEHLLEDQLTSSLMNSIAMPMPSHFNKHPNLDTVPTSYDFSVGVPGNQNTNVVFQNQKLFIKMDSKMTVTVTYKEQQKGEPLYLRAMILFASTENMHLPVNRCANHPYRPSNEELNKHDDKEARFASIIKINNPHASYKGIKTGETFGQRLSVVVPLDGDKFDSEGNITQTLCMEFGCQNSCASGINRRPTTLVFTLENESLQLLGRSVVEFKVCSCPKRDAEREREAPKKKRDGEKPYPRGKRPKYAEPARLVKTEPESESDNNTDVVPNDSVTTISMMVPSDLIPEILKGVQEKIALKLVTDATSQTLPQYEICLKNLRQLEKQYEKK